MTRAAKLVWNTNNWEMPDGLGGNNGVNVLGPNVHYSYGLEEFLRCPEQMEMSIGYLNCYRNFNLSALQPENVALFSQEFIGGPIMHIGNLHDVLPLQNEVRNHIWDEFNGNNFINLRVNSAFCEIEGLLQGEFAAGTEVFLENNFGENLGNLPNIHGEAPNGFFVNIQYGRLDFFADPVNLTEIYQGVNGRWSRLSPPYIVENSPSPELIEYLQNSFL
jgi:hypothetical protein